MSVTVERTVAELDPLSAMDTQHDRDPVSNSDPTAEPTALARELPPSELSASALSAGADGVGAGHDADTTGPAVGARLPPFSGQSGPSIPLGSGRILVDSGARVDTAKGTTAIITTASSAIRASTISETKSKSSSFPARVNPVIQQSFVPALTTLNRLDDVSFACAVPSTSTKTDERGKMFTVYNIKLSALGTRWVVPKRFSELEYLNDALRKRFPDARLPKFPSKGGLGGLFRRLDDATIEKRRADLQTYLDGALSNHAVYKSMLLRMFFEIPRGIEKANREAAEQDAVRTAKNSRAVVKGDGNALGPERSEVVENSAVSLDVGECTGGGVKVSHSNRGSLSSRRDSSGIQSSGRTLTRPVLLFANQRRHQNKGIVRADFDGIRQAIKDGELDTVQKILAVSDRLGRYVDPSGQSMLHLACMFSHTEIAMALVEVGADPGLGNSHGETAYDLAPRALAQRMAVYVDSWQDDDTSGTSGGDSDVEEAEKV